MPPDLLAGLCLSLWLTCCCSLASHPLPAAVLGIFLGTPSSREFSHCNPLEGGPCYSNISSVFFWSSPGLHAIEIISMQCSTRLNLINLSLLYSFIFLNLYFREPHFNNEKHHHVYQIKADSDLAILLTFIISLGLNLDKFIPAW